MTVCTTVYTQYTCSLRKRETEDRLLVGGFLQQMSALSGKRYFYVGFVLVRMHFSTFIIDYLHLQSMKLRAIGFISILHTDISIIVESIIAALKTQLCRVY